MAPDLQPHLCPLSTRTRGLSPSHSAGQKRPPPGPAMSHLFPPPAAPGVHRPGLCKLHSDMSLSPGLERWLTSSDRQPGRSRFAIWGQGPRANVTMVGDGEGTLPPGGPGRDVPEDMAPVTGSLE
jgi:hypothetical protein